MDAPILTAITTFAGMLAVAFAVNEFLLRRPSALIRRRIDHHAVEVETRDGKRLERINVLKDGAYSPSPLLDALLRRFRPARTAVGELARADWNLTVLPYLLLRLLVAAGAGAVVWLVTGNPLFAGAAGAAGILLPRFLLRWSGRKRLKAFEAQLAEMMELLVGALRSGHGFLQAIESAARDMDDPMRKELLRIIDRVNIGVSPVDALLEVPERIDSYDLGLFTAAVAVQRQSGGNLAEVLENLAHTVRERRRIRAEVMALTTGPRVSSYVLFGIPVGLTLYFLVASPPHQEAFSTTLGKVGLGGAAIWALLGYLLSQKVSKVEY